MDRQRPEAAPDGAIEPVVNAVWIGASLDDLHAACLRSFVLAGHRVHLHCYDTPRNVPPGVETVDASKLMPRERIVYYRSNGSPSLFSNLYRLKILEAGLGPYVDCDVFCLKPIPKQDYILGYQSSDQLNGAVLKLPAGSQTLLEMLKFAEDPYYIVPWLNRSRLMRYRLRKFIGLPIHISNYSWGRLGPEALTYFASRTGDIGQAVPIDVFYPLSHHQVAMLLDPDLSLSDIGTPRTLCIHLFDHTLRQWMIGRTVPQGSPLGQMLERCGLSTAAGR
ncbi:MULTISPECIES: galactosyltransferase Lgt5 [unclassified Mesorhizobium]|uniref:galactosyltransferase Lgt5 n=1 Tax=unclassified Mesorhizobium TaxID=325217 RepID=UPI000FDA8E19|nr:MULTISPECIES: galactosyltransferase Lgt5 [unclassified Mesorhizobium]TGU26704.1 galactosyltransferase Lgt5 [bacterium M00.F.Ca.ET.156.01.1.1]TGV11666.1 galactosyltransferase Lgt5 [Mesorhizobium sp. M8A.F.Ca.ET.173.01.1.1]TGV83424.1 galactosyltransferase Lgt5 [Mesorhizobium sp. M00.F.Ca.ET.149.01.1.1]TGQ78558.1 galactosyltransferase Lgt5 [Mesorhizobium sp. M8A.F.Ca.ET.207.01.1.1]TGR20100.1 galactosyltransferase Lgt5 [Mesorhizobium sp. M8A.F.Ca.ET.202.01.1.1]